MRRAPTICPRSKMFKSVSLPLLAIPTTNSEQRRRKKLDIFGKGNAKHSSIPYRTDRIEGERPGLRRSFLISGLKESVSQHSIRCLEVMEQKYDWKKVLACVSCRFGIC
ncbi:hypothetical protein TNCV_2359691 [Trichonephila clavipes]|nr:hypothetical protein TNCV_2359691 [Trichonephila clavipes]